MKLRLIALTVFGVMSAQAALIIDDFFTGPGPVTPLTSFGAAVTDNSNLTLGNFVGLKRTTTVQRTSGGGGVRVSFGSSFGAVPDVGAFSTDAGTQGTVLFEYDFDLLGDGIAGNEIGISVPADVWGWSLNQASDLAMRYVVTFRSRPVGGGAEQTFVYDSTVADSTAYNTLTTRDIFGTFGPGFNLNNIIYASILLDGTRTISPDAVVHQFNFEQVPEPGTYALLGGGLLLMGMLRRRKQ